MELFLNHWDITSGTGYFAALKFLIFIWRNCRGPTAVFVNFRFKSNFLILMIWYLSDSNNIFMAINLRMLRYFLTGHFRKWSWAILKRCSNAKFRACCLQCQLIMSTLARINFIKDSFLLMGTVDKECTKQIILYLLYQLTFPIFFYKSEY